MSAISSIIDPVIAAVVWAGDKVPKDDDVVQGVWGAVVFVALILAVAFLGFSLVKQLGKAQRAEEEGRYDPDPARSRPAAPAAQPPAGD